MSKQELNTQQIAALKALLNGELDRAERDGWFLTGKPLPNALAETFMEAGLVKTGKQFPKGRGFRTEVRLTAKGQKLAVKF